MYLWMFTVLGIKTISKQEYTAHIPFSLQAKDPQERMNKSDKGKLLGILIGCPSSIP